MTLNYFTLGFIGGYFGAYIRHNGISYFKKEFQGAKYSVTKKGLSLDTLVQTANLGEFEIKILKNSKGKFDLDEINYDPNLTLLPQMDLYKASIAIMPSASISPFSYKITTKNKNTDIRLFVKYGILNGSTKVKIGPDRNGVYQVKRVTFYDGSGKRLYAFVPPVRKLGPITPVLATPTKSTTSTAKPSP